ncbi:CU044_5270 family protein [Actinomadura geliboluensis]|uniref:CU044_5270 family protein n=1 Tax=Actinomadura geliboluensis TaxID=882440 RepID=UPI00371D45DB
MTDLREVRELWSEAAEPEPARLAAVRQRFLRDTRPGGLGARRRWRAWGVRTAAAGGLVAAVTAGTFVVAGGSGPGSAPASAAELLTLAAQAAGDGQVADPRPGQFAYRESVALELSTGSGGSWFRKVRYQEWRRADGGVPVYRRTTLLGLVPLPGGKVPAQAWELARAGTGARFLPCAFEPTEPNAPYAVHRALPTDPARLRGALAAGVDAGQRAELSEDQAVWINLTALASAQPPPRVQAALFTVARQIQGTRLSGRTTDAAGRPGLAVTLDTRPGEHEELIFDAKTYRFLGWRGTATGDTLPAATTTADVAVTKTAITDGLPAGVSTSGHTCPDTTGG